MDCIFLCPSFNQIFININNFWRLNPENDKLYFKQYFEIIDSMYLSNASSSSGKFQSAKQQQQESIKVKEQQDQTINSEGDLESEFNQDEQYQRSQHNQKNQKFEASEQEVVSIEVKKEMVQVEQLNTEMQEEKPLTLNFMSMPSNQRNNLQTYKSSNRKLVPINQHSLSQSMISNMTLNNKGAGFRKINAFYYDRIGDQLSLIFMENKNIIKFLARETKVLILVVQNEIGEFCFIDGIDCSSYWVMIMVICQIIDSFQIRDCILQKLIQVKNGRPLMEYFVLILMTILTDFIMIFWVGFNEDWLFIVYVYIIGLVVFFNTFRMKTWPSQLLKGLSYFLYDVTIIGLLLVCFKLLPSIKQSLRDHNPVAWNEYYMFIYAFLDLGMEIIMDLTLSLTKFSELYIYQGQLLIIGTRVGTLIQADMARFDFWFCLFFLIMFRINNISIVFTVFFRRLIYYASPNSLKPYVSMEETNLTRKGKKWEACWEHLFWIIYFYMFIISGRTFTNWVFDKSYISNGKFETSIWDGYEKSNYMPIIVWAFLLNT
ncbi:unnamed protein product (macronuclear) [Paramecium tetraurelia]|uniref:Ion transport domain-containing protein n=1 Tax=Paramecium tetraurelia TaxID=5888 RepID=A0DKY6_PARTE|nr:uncharacterized protein GSPATT00018020001 [Paramecium tetraurelia]CAK83703.1 unnamed protein product [Paramecium tetraurelia]|eukprot:XP_001451100.1 hypothetical protein (macronuclear) [Paramecium tetraurelia strain d4-2]